MSQMSQCETNTHTHAAHTHIDTHSGVPEESKIGIFPSLLMFSLKGKIHYPLLRDSQFGQMPCWSSVEKGRGLFCEMKPSGLR